MEPAEQISEEWSSLSGWYTAEEADFMNQMRGNCSVPENLGIPSTFWPCHESTIVRVTGINNCSYFPAQFANTNVVCFSQGSSSNFVAHNSSIFPTTTSANCSSNDLVAVTNFGYMSMGLSLEDFRVSPDGMQGNDSLQINENTDEKLSLDPGITDKNLQVHKECEMLVSETAEDDKTRSLENSGKRCSRSMKVPKNRRNVKSRKNPKSASISNTEEGGDRSPGVQGQTLSSSCCLEDDSYASRELNGGVSSSLSPNDSNALKSRSNRGPATDTQIVYARRRRERINERLRILQNLVPNGTKVDISTMLEEAIQYVNFL